MMMRYEALGSTSNENRSRGEEESLEEENVSLEMSPKLASKIENNEESKYPIDDVDQIGVVVEAFCESINGRHVENFAAESYF